MEHQGVLLSKGGHSFTYSLLCSQNKHKKPHPVEKGVSEESSIKTKYVFFRKKDTTHL